MEYIYTTSFKRTVKKIIDKRSLNSSHIDKTLDIFSSHHLDARLHFKKIVCKSDKSRHSIRIINTSYRIIFTIIDNIAYFICVCDHDDYDRRNRNC